MPKTEQEKLVLLIDELKDSGPVEPCWPNYSKLSATRVEMVKEMDRLLC